MTRRLPHRTIAALEGFDRLRRFEQARADGRRLNAWLLDLLGHLSGLIAYDRPRCPDFLSFGCAQDPEQVERSRLAAEIDAVWADLVTSHQRIGEPISLERTLCARWMLDGEGLSPLPRRRAAEDEGAA